MNHLARATIVAAIVVVLGTSAYAVAQTGRLSGAKKISIVVAPATSSPESTSTPEAASAAATSTKPPIPAAKKTPADTTRRSSSSARPKKNSAKRKSESAPPAPAQKPVVTQEPSREVVKPEVREDGDHATDSGGTRDDHVSGDTREVQAKDSSGNPQEVQQAPEPVSVSDQPKE